MREAGCEAANNLKSNQSAKYKLTLEYGASCFGGIEFLYLILLVNHERRLQRGLSTTI